MKDETNRAPTTSAVPVGGPNDVAPRIKKARENRGLTQGSVATRTRVYDPEKKGISRTTLVAYEQGTTSPGLREIRLLCEVLGITPNWLIYGDAGAVATQPSSELLGPRLSEFETALRIALALSALKGHERDALQSIVLSMAGRQLGDLRLSGLLSSTAYLAEPMLKELAGDEGPELSLQQLVEKLSKGVRATVGNRLTLDDDGNPIAGQVVYPDPEGNEKW